MYLNISDENEVNENSTVESVYETHRLENYANKDVDHVKHDLEDMGYDVLVIGNGLDVVAQYPKAHEDVFTSQMVFLYTGGQTFSMPDMTGWSRKEVLAYWSFTNIPVQSVGSGYVVEQNIAEGELIDKNDTIYVVFK